MHIVSCVNRSIGNDYFGHLSQKIDLELDLIVRNCL